MSSSQDLKAIDELRAMARIYQNHGFADKAGQLIILADEMEARLKRTASQADVVNMDSFRAADMVVADENI